MYFKQILDERCGCASYLIASRKSHEAAIVDPSIETEQYEGAINIPQADLTSRLNGAPRPGARRANRSPSATPAWKSPASPNRHGPTPTHRVAIGFNSVAFC